MTKKKPEPNPIEKAIGDRAKDPKALENFTKEYQTEPTPETPSQIPSASDQPLTQAEMVNLEDLNRSAEARLQDYYLEDPLTVSHTVPKVPVLKPENQPVAENSTPESPPQKKIEQYNKTAEKIGIPKKLSLEEIEDKLDLELAKEAQERGDFIPLEDLEKEIPTSAEDAELTALRKYILEDGFVVATTAFHIVTLCAQPMVTPSTTTWDFKERANVPEMVFTLLRQPGYLEGIWPSLKIVMGSNAGNSAWCSGIAMTIAFFDVVRTLPVLKELQQCSPKK